MKPIKTVSMYVFHGKAYLPTLATTDVGAYFDVEPFNIAALEVEDLQRAVEEQRQRGHPVIPIPSREELAERAKIPLHAIKARSWKQLAREGATYSIHWADDKVILEMYRLDEKGRWVTDPVRTRDFPRDIPLRGVLQAILDDVRSRPELLAVP